MRARAAVRTLLPSSSCTSIFTLPLASRLSISKETRFRIVARARGLCTSASFEEDSQQRVPVTKGLPLEKLRAAIEELGMKLGIGPEDEKALWYKITTDVVKRHGGESLLKRFGGSLSLLLRTAYPEYDWLQWEFPTVPQSFWAKEDNQRRFIEYVANKVGIVDLSYEKLRSITKAHVLQYGGRGLLRLYGNSLKEVISTLYPPPSPSSSPLSKQDKHSLSIQTQKELLERIWKKLGLQGGLESWYNVTPLEISQKGGRTLIKLYSGNLFRLFSTLYPHFPWEKDKFNERSSTLLASLGKQREFLDSISPLLGVPPDNLEAWYKVSKEKLRELGGGDLLSLYHGSLTRLLMSVFPDHKWNPERFEQSTRISWKDPETQRKHIMEISAKLGINEANLDKWYSVPNDEFIRVGGSRSLLKVYKGNLGSLLQAVYPHHHWTPWGFPSVPKNFWDSPQNLRSFLNSISPQLGIKDGNMDLWYNVTNALLKRHGGGGALNHYGGSLISILRSAYPEIEWYPWRFLRVSERILNDPSQFGTVFREVEEALGICTPEDWLRVKYARLADLGVARFFQKYGGLLEVLKKQYPAQDWKDLEEK